MPFISHRGARGLAAENSLDGIKIAAKLNVEFIEFDIQKTADKKLVLFHNQSIDGQKISEITYKELLKKHPGVPELSSALKACGDKKPLVEIKSLETAKLALNTLKKHSDLAVTSFLAEEIVFLRDNLQKQTLFIMQPKHPFGLLKKATNLGADGIGVNKNWGFILPFIYSRAKKRNLVIYTYTVNNRFIAALLLSLMPNLFICSDNPQKLENLETTKKLAVTFLFVVTFLLFFKLGFLVVSAL